MFEIMGVTVYLFNALFVPFHEKRLFIVYNVVNPLLYGDP